MPALQYCSKYEDSNTVTPIKSLWEVGRRRQGMEQENQNILKCENSMRNTEKYALQITNNLKKKFGPGCNAVVG